MHCIATGHEFFQLLYLWKKSLYLKDVFNLYIIKKLLLVFYLACIVKWRSEVSQSCPTLCDPMGCSLPGFSIHGIFQARVLEWLAISFSRGSSRPRDWTQVSRIGGRRFNLWATRKAHGSKWVKSLSRVWLCATPWTVAYYAPPSMGFSRQEYWSGLPFPSPEDLPDPGIKPRSPAL